MLVKKRLFWILCASWVLFTLLMLLFLDFGKKTIFPKIPDTFFYIGTSHEQVKTDSTQVKLEMPGDSLIRFSYTLGTASHEPFGAVYLIQADAPKQFMDIGPYNRLSIYLKADKAKRIPIFITLDIKGFTSEARPLSSLPLVKVLDYTGEGYYHLPIRDFEIPSWWLRHHGWEKDKVPHLDYSRSNYIVVNSCQTLKAGSTDTLEIRSIELSNDNTRVYIWYAVGTFFMLLIYVVSQWQGRKQKILIPYQATETVQGDSKIDRIIHYLSTHYTDPELSAQEVQKALGISTREIGTLIKTHLSSSFKEYLNTIRLAEVKRLLKETDLPISDIAYKTGYNNIPHFNRVFKAECGCAPKEYRENNS